MQKVEWHVAFFDEAHKLKKRSNSIFEAARSLKTKRCYGLTGTAMQVKPPLESHGHASMQIELCLDLSFHVCGNVGHEDRPFPAQRNSDFCTAQNAYEELWTLLHWANPALMGDWQQFSDYYVKPLKMGQKKDATELHVAKVACICTRFSFYQRSNVLQIISSAAFGSDQSSGIDARV